MTSWPILSLMIFIPLFGAFFISLVDGDERTIIKNTKMVAMWTSVVVLILSIFVWVNFQDQKDQITLILVVSYLLPH